MPRIVPARILVIMPNWLGDAVMATPFLRALRKLYPAAHIAAAGRPLVMPVLAGNESFVNEIYPFAKGEEARAVGWIRGQRFDLGILLPNSFRSAWMLWRGGVKRRLGYARGGRGFLLTERLWAKPRTAEQALIDGCRAIARRQIASGKEDIVRIERDSEGTGRLRVISRSGGGAETVRETRRAPLPWQGGGFEPVPMINHYLAIAGYLQAVEEVDGTPGFLPDFRMILGVTDAERDEATAALAAMGIGDSAYAVLVPGANFGSSKCWLAERFAEVARRLVEERGLRVILAGAPGEAPIIEAILRDAPSERVHALTRLNGGKGVSVGALEELVRRAKLMICNDTGPRHFAAAFDVPVVTLFGPTDPVWAETWHARERIVRLDVPCGPCQLKTCPIDHRCMKGITVEMVMAAVGEVLK